MNCFSEQRTEIGLLELSDMLDINKSTLHGIISTLKEYGFMDQDPDTQKYRLGFKLAVLGSIVMNSIDIVRIAKPIIDKVSEELEETVHLAALEADEVVYIEKKESYQSMRILTTIGARNPAYATGVGKAMLAFLGKRELQDHLPEQLLSLTPKTIIDRDLLLEELETVRDRGYAKDDEENILGLTCIAAPIFTSDSVAKYAISVSGPTVRMTEDKIRRSIEVIGDAARQITSKLNIK